MTEHAVNDTARLTTAEPRWPRRPRPPGGAPNIVAIVPAPWNGTLISVRLQTPGPRPAGPLDELRSALHAD